jgi:peroxiredoxin-like protein
LTNDQDITSLQEKIVQAKDRNGRRKQFTYSTQVSWKGERTGVLSSVDRNPIIVSSPPEFNGMGGIWTPEDLFVGAIEMCQLLTFLALAERTGLRLMSYRSNASGTLELIDGAFRFTEVVVRPHIVVDSPDGEPDILDLVKQAHRLCLISNSVAATVKVEPTIVLESPVAAP